MTDDDSASTPPTDAGESVDDGEGTTSGRGDRDEGSDGGVREGPGGREVVVPMRLYKTVTVMATLLAMVGVVGGFVLLDVATNRATAEIEEIDPLLALLGLGLIVGGAATYAYSTRFRAEGMGRSKTDEGEGSGDG